MNKTEQEWNKFIKIMKTPLVNIPQKDLEWAAKQDKFNSILSKKIFEEEIKRRTNKLNKKL